MLILMKYTSSRDMEMLTLTPLIRTEMVVDAFNLLIDMPRASRFSLNQWDKQGVVWVHMMPLTSCSVSSAIGFIKMVMTDKSLLSYLKNRI